MGGRRDEKIFARLMRDLTDGQANGTVECRQVPPPGGTQSRLAWPGGGGQPRGVLLYDLKSGCFEPIATFGPPVQHTVVTKR
eukprot:scaffold16494_cov83-Cyclotella_meneghiniana.AAC.2